MKSVRSFRSTADDSALSKRPAVPDSIFQSKNLVRAALLVALAGASLAAVAHHHGWLSILGNGDRAMQVAPQIAVGLLPESTATGTFTKIDVSGAGTAAMEGTFTIDINTASEVTGMYSNSPGVLHGFVRDKDGTITKFDASNSGTGSFEGTLPLSINLSGEIAGTVIDSNHTSHGFVRKNGTMTEFDVSGAGTAANRGTAAWRINDAGDVVGFFSTDGSSSMPPTYHGFLRKANGTITNIDDPKAGTGLDPQNGRKEGTQAYAINGSGTIVGSYVDSSNDRHGFIYTSGSFTNFDAPGASTNTGKHGGLSGTIPTGIDANGVVVGTFTNAAGLRRGFVRDKEGTFKTFDGPAAAASGLIEGTFPFNIDSSTGVVVGFDADANGFYHAFERSESGTVTEIKPPGAVGSSETVLPGAGAGGVNEYGDVAGGYSDANGVYHGFIFSPTSTPQVAPPTYLPAKRTYVGPVSVSVTIKDATSGATIHYTLDKSTPPTSKTTKEYSVPITISKTTTIEAIAEKLGYANSSVVTATYTILKPQTISWPKITKSYPAGSTLAISAKASSGLPVTFASTTTKVCTVSKSVASKATASFLKVGTCKLLATQAGNAIYAPAPAAPNQVTVVEAK